MATLAEQLIKSLRALGVKYVFGIPGGPSIPYMEAMRNNGIEFILVSNEQSAAIMADVSARLTGIPGSAMQLSGQVLPICQQEWPVPF